MKEAHLTVDIEFQREQFRLRINLSVGREILVLFGPSGAGKTTILNAIAGLITPDSGEITFDGVTFFRKHRSGENVNLPARKRRIGYVFQDYALFPHMTAIENVAYSLWRQRDSRLHALTFLKKMGIAHLGDRYPHELSGGQKQRVAVARALAPNPHILLLDEPFSAIDMSLRERLHGDLHALQHESSLVIICVTHNLEDVFALGHRLAVIQDGHIGQIGLVEDVFRRPANHNVAGTMGIRNLFQARVVYSRPTGIVLNWDGFQLETPFQPVQSGEIVTAYIRPEDIKILYPDMPLSKTVSYNQITGNIISRESGTNSNSLRVHLTNGNELQVRFPLYAYSSLSLVPGKDVRLSLRREGVTILKPDKVRVNE